MLHAAFTLSGDAGSGDSRCAWNVNERVALDWTTIAPHSEYVFFFLNIAGRRSRRRHHRVAIRFLFKGSSTK
jgi:hypothetical protein